MGTRPLHDFTILPQSPRFIVVRVGGHWEHACREAAKRRGPVLYAVVAREKPDTDTESVARRGLGRDALWQVCPNDFRGGRCFCLTLRHHALLGA